MIVVLEHPVRIDRKGAIDVEPYAGADQVAKPAATSLVIERLIDELVAQDASTDLRRSREPQAVSIPRGSGIAEHPHIAVVEAERSKLQLQCRRRAKLMLGVAVRNRQ